MANRIVSELRSPSKQLDAMPRKLEGDEKQYHLRTTHESKRVTEADCSAE